MNNKALILMYHAIDNVKSDPWSTFVSTENFEYQINLLNKEFNIIPLDDLIRNQLQVPEPSVVITFDDGYANNLYNAKPVLEKYGAPATFFITTQNLGSNNEYWWDQLERIFFQKSELLGELSLKIGDDDLHWIFDESNSSNGINETRLLALNSIRKKMMSLNIEEKDQIISDLQKWAQISKECRSTHRVLNISELRKLVYNDLFEIGCHTYSHPVLSKLDSKSQEYEISYSKKQLEEILDIPISGFSYPFGKEKHYNQDTLNILKERGFSYACTSVEETVSKSIDVFLLPRIFVEDWNEEKFLRNINRIFDN